MVPDTIPRQRFVGRSRGVARRPAHRHLKAYREGVPQSNFSRRKITLRYAASPNLGPHPRPVTPTFRYSARRIPRERVVTECDSGISGKRRRDYFAGGQRKRGQNLKPTPSPRVTTYCRPSVPLSTSGWIEPALALNSRGSARGAGRGWPGDRACSGLPDMASIPSDPATGCD